MSRRRTAQEDTWRARMEWICNEIGRNVHPHELLAAVRERYGLKTREAHYLMSEARGILRRAVALRTPQSAIDLSARVMDCAERAMVAGDYRAGLNALKEYRAITQGLSPDDYTPGDIALSLCALLADRGLDVTDEALDQLIELARRTKKQKRELKSAKSKNRWKRRAADEMSEELAGSFEATVAAGEEYAAPSWDALTDAERGKKGKK